MTSKMKFFIKFFFLPALASILIIGVISMAYPQKVKSQLIELRDYTRGIEYNKFKPSADVIWGIDISHHQRQIAWTIWKNQNPILFF